MPAVLRVALPVPLPTLFDYLPPATGEAGVGSRVLVPFGRGRLVGVVVAIEAEAAVDDRRLKQVLRLLDDAALLDPELMQTLAWAADYWLGAPGEAYANALPLALREAKPLPAIGDEYWSLTVGRPQRPRRRQPARRQQGLAGPAGGRRLERAGTERAPARLARRGAPTGCRRPARAQRTAAAQPPAATLGSTATQRRTTAGGGHRRRQPRPVSAVPARRRHRQRQDRGLSGADRAGAGARQAGAAAGAGDRPCAADRAAPARAARGDRRGAALEPVRRRPRARLAARPRRQRAGDPGHPFGDVHAAAASRPDHRRRGTRQRLQAAGGLPLPRPRSGPGARPRARRAGAAGLGHALAGIAGERRRRPLSHPAPARPTRRDPAAAGADHRHARAAAGARHVAGAARRRGGHGGARRAGAGVPQPPRLRAGAAVPRLRLARRLPALRPPADPACRPTPVDLPSLRLPPAHAAGLPDLRRRRPEAAGPGHRAAGGSAGRAVPAGAGAARGSRDHPPPRRVRATAGHAQGRPAGDPGRHPDAGQGPRPAQPHPGRHRGRGRGPAQRGFPRRANGWRNWWCRSPAAPAARASPAAWCCRRTSRNTRCCAACWPTAMPLPRANCWPSAA